MQYQDEVTKAHRKKIIIVSIASGIVVLLLGILIVSVAMNSVSKTGKNTDETSTVAKKETKKPDDQKDDGSDDSASSDVTKPASSDGGTPTPSTSTPSTPATSTTPATPATPANEVPTTGPADIALSALLMGVATYLALNLAATKRKAAIEA